MFNRRLLFAGYIALLLVHLLFSVNCHANNNQNQQQILHKKKNSCGDIHNISFPYRLKAHPLDYCGHKHFELDCENNRTVLYLNSGKYYVQAINYHNSTIRLVDAGIQRNNYSALPLHSLTHANFTSHDPYCTLVNELAVLVSCEKAVKSPLYIDTISSSAVSSSKRHSYVLFGEVKWSDVASFCSLDMIFPTRPLSDRRERNISRFSDVHNELADGFELYWMLGGYKKCRLQALCSNDAQNAAGDCQKYFHLSWIQVFLDNLRYFLSDHLYLELKIIGGIFSPRILFALCAVAFLIYKFRRRHLSMFDNIECYLRSQNHLMPISYSYADIKKMTKGFKDKLGEGGYGSVYKGKLRSGHLVAIKVLGKPKTNGQEFINEIATIGRIHHVNVVKLIGYCAERSKRALIYDFMPNGSLEKYIFSQQGNISLSCDQMYEISLGVARGIEYLHRGCEMQILHFDIKPHNILLDENFTPKVSDFGLAKLYSTYDSIVPLTAARGTLGYMAPELFYKNIGGVSYKADVYSFGMLLMEIAGRRRNWNALADSSQIYFPCWVYDQFTNGMLVKMGDITEEQWEEVKKMMLVALWCIQMKPSDRPSMNKVMEMLEGNTESVPMPPRPFLYPQEMPTQNHGIDVNPTNLPTLSGACLDDITLDISAR